jgi:hypothetical protein
VRTRRRKKFARWLPAEDLLLQAGVEDGLGLSALAELVGSSIGGVRWRLAQLGLSAAPAPNPFAWSAEEDQILRDEYGKPGFETREIARRIGCSLYRLKNRVHKLGLKHYRRWTPAERKALRARYATDCPKAIAADLGKSVIGVYLQARKMGLHACGYHSPIPAKTIARVKRLFAAGHPDRVIAIKAGIDRDQAKYLRTLHCSPRGHPDIEGKRLSVKHQLKTLGLTSPTQLRTRAFQRFAAESGWPEDLRPREVQILNVLAAQGGAMSRMELAQAIGMRTDRIGTNGAPVLLFSNGPSGSYSANLVRRGLLIRLVNFGPARTAGKSGKGSARKCDLYTLGPAALALLQERAKCVQQPMASSSGSAKASERPSA